MVKAKEAENSTVVSGRLIIIIILHGYIRALSNAIRFALLILGTNWFHPWNHVALNLVSYDQTPRFYAASGHR